MRTQARKRIRLAVFLFLAALIGPSVWWMNRWYRQERLDHDLIAAVEKNDTVAAIALLNAGADPNTTRGDKPPSSLIDLLRDYRDRETEGGSDYRFDHPPALLLLLKIRRDARNIRCAPPENPALAKALLEHGAKVDARDSFDETPLMWAAFDGYTETARLLLDHGADLHARGVAPWSTPLRMARPGVPNGVLKLLMDRGAGQDREEVTAALNHLCGSEHASPADVELLLHYGADVNPTSTLRRATSTSPLLLHYGIENATDDFHVTALMRAAEAGNAEVVRTLLRHGADVHARDAQGATALIHAAHQDNAEVVSLLLDAGAKVNARAAGLDNRTALFWAAARGNYQVVLTLLEAGADSTMQDAHGQAAHSGNRSIDRLMLIFATHSTHRLLQQRQREGEER